MTDATLSPSTTADNNATSRKPGGRLATYQTSVRTPLSPEDAFAYMADLRNFEAWDPGVKSSKLVTGTEPGEGAEYDVKASGLTLTYRTTEFEPNRRTVVIAEHPLLTSRDEIVIAPDSGGSIVTYRAELELPTVINWLTPALQLGFDRVGDRAANGLADALDGSRLD